MPVINRQWENIYKLSYDNTTDEYGQLRQFEAEPEMVSVVWKQFDQKNVSNPNYVDIDVIVLTVADIKVGDQLIHDGKIYDVKYIIPGKYTQVFLKYLKDAEV